LLLLIFSSARQHSIGGGPLYGYALALLYVSILKGQCGIDLQVCLLCPWARHLTGLPLPLSD